MLPPLYTAAAKGASAPRRPRLFFFCRAPNLSSCTTTLLLSINGGDLFQHLCPIGAFLVTARTRSIRGAAEPSTGSRRKCCQRRWGVGRAPGRKREDSLCCASSPPFAVPYPSPPSVAGIAFLRPSARHRRDPPAITPQSIIMVPAYPAAPRRGDRAHRPQLETFLVRTGLCAMCLASSCSLKCLICLLPPTHSRGFRGRVFPPARQGGRGDVRRPGRNGLCHSSPPPCLLAAASLPSSLSSLSAVLPLSSRC